MWQYIVITLIGIYIVFILIRKIYRAIKNPDSLSDGCKDCPLHQNCKNVGKGAPRKVNGQCSDRQSRSLPTL
mgnify:FL=1